jgi:hypothetical protein
MEVSVCLTAWLFNQWGTDPWHPLNRNLGHPKSHSVTQIHTRIFKQITKGLTLHNNLEVLYTMISYNTV